MSVHDYSFFERYSCFFIQFVDMVYVVYPLTFISAKITKNGVKFCYSFCSEISVRSISKI